MNTLNLIIDIVVTNKRGEQYLALPGQCFLYHTYEKALKKEAARIVVHAAVKDAAGAFVTGITANNLRGRFIQHFAPQANIPLAEPSGIYDIYSPTAYDLLQRQKVVTTNNVVSGKPAFENDFSFMESTIDSTIGTSANPSIVPMLYIRHTNKAESILGAASVVQMYCASHGADLYYLPMVRLPLAPLYMNWRDAAQDWNVPIQQAQSLWHLSLIRTLAKLEATEVFLGWEPRQCPTMGQPGCPFGDRVKLDDYNAQFRVANPTAERYRNLFQFQHTNSRLDLELVDIFRDNNKVMVQKGELPL